jgi:hypothetical protein
VQLRRFSREIRLSGGLSIMADFIPTLDRPAPYTRTEGATSGHPAFDAWQAGLDAANAARHGPPTAAEAHNAAQIAVVERFLHGRVRTPGLRRAEPR